MSPCHTSTSSKTLCRQVPISHVYVSRGLFVSVHIKKLIISFNRIFFWTIYGYQPKRYGGIVHIYKVVIIIEGGNKDVRIFTIWSCTIPILCKCCRGNWIWVLVCIYRRAVNLTFGYWWRILLLQLL